MNALTDLETDLIIAKAEIEMLKAENEILRQRLDNECDSCACEIANERDSLRNELCDALEKANAQIESIHKSLDFAETQRQKSKNYTELAINNGLALGRIAVTIQHDFGPLPAASRKGTEHERD